MSWKIPTPWREAVAAYPGPKVPGLPPRLARVALCVPEGARVADVGADHGQLGAALLRTGRSPRVWAVDLSDLALEGARRTLRAEVRAGTASVLLGDGLGPIAPAGGPVECLVVAGTGAQTALEIVERSLASGHRPRTVILQPYASEGLVRASMMGHGYGLSEEHVVRDGQRLFIVLKFQLGEGVRELRSPVDRFVGPFLSKDLGAPVTAWLHVQADWLRDTRHRSDDAVEREALGERLRAVEHVLAARSTADSVKAY